MKELKILKTQRNRQKIIYDEYIYVFDRKNKECLSWRCSKKHCRGRLYTDFDIKNVLSIIEHHHDKETSKIIRMELNKSLKNKAENTRDAFDIALLNSTSNFSN
ncbi:hypothetical protein DMUE_0620 [Dictyocoela muelleri]|nr:hypothetical protein DMUE_0620 [Dictyocoela muelleri]